MAPSLAQVSTGRDACLGTLDAVGGNEPIACSHRIVGLQARPTIPIYVTGRAWQVLCFHEQLRPRSRPKTIQAEPVRLA